MLMLLPYLLCQWPKSIINAPSRLSTIDVDVDVNVDHRKSMSMSLPYLLCQWPKSIIDAPSRFDDQCRCRFLICFASGQSRSSTLQIDCRRLMSMSLPYLHCQWPKSIIDAP